MSRFPLPTWFARELDQCESPSPLSLWWIGLQFARLRKENAPQALSWVHDEGAVVETRRSADGAWHCDRSSRFNRRITAQSRLELTGPLAGHPLLQTSDDPSGRLVRGMLHGRGGEPTPWGTMLCAEDAFDLGAEPNEYARFGYVVEIDPYDPTSMPRKHTALGRFKRSAVVPVIARDRRMVVYSGDDAPLEYTYKFVTDGRFDPFDRRANLSLFERGTLFAAKFRPDGGGEWLPLLYGTGPLTEAHGFHSQAEVLVDTRRAADLLGATGIARLDAIDVSTVTSRVRITLSGHGAVEIEEELDDHAVLRFRWEIATLPRATAADDGAARGRLGHAPGGAAYEMPGPETTIFGS